MSFSLIRLTDDWMTRPRIGLHRSVYLYPSEASVEWTDQYDIRRVAGTCLRQAYWRITKSQEAAPPDAYSEWIFALGKAVEQILVEQYKQMGLWVANNLKFTDEKHRLSGEVDVIIRDPSTGQLCILEVKSFYGYQATKDICGSKGSNGKPKTSQLLQSLVYVDQCKELTSYVKMIYYARDSAARSEFDIALVQDGQIRRPEVNGILDYRFTMEDIYERYEKLAWYLDTQNIPDRDYAIHFSPEMVERLHDIGEVSKTAYDAYLKKKERPGNWQCRYCPYKKPCWQK